MIWAEERLVPSSGPKSMVSFQAGLRASGKSSTSVTRPTRMSTARNWSKSIWGAGSSVIAESKQEPPPPTNYHFRDGTRARTDPPPSELGSLGSLDALTPPTLLLMALAGALAVLDGVFSHSLIVVSLLAFPPVIAATRVSVAETALVGVFCLSLAILSGLWNQNFGASDYFVRLLVVLAGAGAAVWVAGLRVSLARERDSADLLAETGLLLQESWDAGDRVEHIARLAVPDLADAATVDLCGRNRSILRSATVARDPEVEAAFERMRNRHPVDPDSAHPAAVAIRTGEMVLYDELPEEMLETFGENRGELDLIRRTRPSSVMVVPLKARGTVLGALSMWILDPSRAHDTRAQNVALRLAHRAGLALDNARLHEQQSHIAHVLQDALRPRSLPEIGGFESASRFLAAGADAYEVGGDFYDAFDTGSGAWTVVIGDVCGKGPEAAALTALARYTIRTASTPESSPSEVLLALDESIAGDRPEVRFCTAALARVHSVQRQRLRRADGRARRAPSPAGAAAGRPRRRDREARNAARRPPGPRRRRRRREPGAQRVAGLLHRRAVGEPRPHQGRRSPLAGLAAQRRQRRQRR